MFLKEGRPPVNTEASGYKYPEDLHHVMSGRIPGDGTFYHHQLI